MNIPGVAVQILRPGDHQGQRFSLRPALYLVQALRRRPVQAVGTQPVYRLRGDRYQPAPPEYRRRSGYVLQARPDFRLHVLALSLLTPGAAPPAGP